MLVYAVDVRSLSCRVTRMVMKVVNDCFVNPVLTLDYSFGVLCQKEREVIGVALVQSSAKRHVISKLCVRSDERHRGIATEIISVVKENIGSDHAVVYIPEGTSDDLLIFFERQGFKVDPLRAGTMLFQDRDGAQQF